MRSSPPESLVQFWFGVSPYEADQYKSRSNHWFQAPAAWDQEILHRFSETIELAFQGEYEAWQQTPHGTLALILLLDQLPRNAFRGTPQAYAYDVRARELTEFMIGSGQDRALHPVERQFAYLPLQHSEQLADQQNSIHRFEVLLGDVSSSHWFYPFAEHGLRMARLHANIIERYGRFPHRNDVLHRTHTFAERMFLDAGGPTFGQSEPSKPTFQIHRPGMNPEKTLCVDGRVFGMRCLSHWPGPPPPEPLRHDLTTGMALTYAKKSVSERRDLLGKFEVITNDHYDTDGVLSAFCMIRPEDAEPHADLLLRSAASGDFRKYQGEDALALDLTIGAIRRSPQSPLVKALESLSTDSDEDEYCYRWFIENLPELCQNPLKYQELYRDRFAAILTNIDRIDSKRDLDIEYYPAQDLAVVVSATPLTRHGLIHAAGEHYRILLVMPSADGHHYRFLYRNETWFLRKSTPLSPRIPLDPIAEQLNQAERSAQGSPKWWNHPLLRTAPELGYGDPQTHSGVFGDVRPDLDPASKLSIATVTDIVTQAFTH